MKAKSKTTSKPKKTSASAKTSKKVSPVKNVPGEEAIREKAREIYFERIARGEHGTAEDDWREAEELFNGLIAAGNRRITPDIIPELSGKGDTFSLPGSSFYSKS